MPSRNIKDCVPELQDAWPKLVAMYEEMYPGKSLRLTATHRTPEEQMLLFKQGRMNYGTFSEPCWVPRKYIACGAVKEYIDSLGFGIPIDFEKCRRVYDVNTSVNERREHQEEFGDIVTNCDGWETLSAHNYYPARAFDVVVIDTTGSKAKELWDLLFYSPLVEMCKKLGLESGAGWKKFVDGPHVQVLNYRSYKPKQ